MVELELDTRGTAEASPVRVCLRSLALPAELKQQPTFSDYNIAQLSLKHGLFHFFSDQSLHNILKDYTEISAQILTTSSLNLELQLNGRSAQRQKLLDVSLLSLLSCPPFFPSASTLFFSPFLFLCNLTICYFPSTFLKYLKVFLCFVLFYSKTWKVLCIALWAIYG